MKSPLEAIVASQTEVTSDDGTEQQPVTAASAMFQATMIRIETRMEALNSDIETAENELQTLELAIAASAINGQQLDALEREFENVQTGYNAAVANLNEAQIGERIETTAQGQRISVIENANIPRLPAGPDRPKIIAAGAAVRRPVELLNRFNVTPLSTIPYMESNVRKNFRRMFLVLGSLVALVGVPLVLWYIDTNYLPLDLLVQKALSRLGIM